MQHSQSLNSNHINKNINGNSGAGSMAKCQSSNFIGNQRSSSGQRIARNESTTFLEQTQMDRIKKLLMEYKRTWQGIRPDQCGRPGTSNIVNKKRKHDVCKGLQLDEEHFHNLTRLLVKIKEIELTRQQERETAEIVEKNRRAGLYGNDSDYRPTPIRVMTNDQFIYFEPIESKHLLNDAPPTIGYARGYCNNETNELLYKLYRGDTKLVRSMLEANYFSHTEAHEWNILWSSGSCKNYLYEGLNEHQKINHFPSSHEITRKDRLAINVTKMQNRYGKEAFDFLPDTYVIPDQFSDFYQHFQRQQQQDPKQNLWIVKPANLSRGRGIYIVDDIAEVSVDELSIVSRYVNNPLLINGHKFDLRIYVTVTSVDPLRIYVFKEGLARFATQKYTSNVHKGNKFIHLTNYSINKKSQNYVHNDNLEQDDYGFKWSLSALCKHLEQIDIDMDLFWSRIFDIIIKSFLSAENAIFNACKKTCIHRTNCYEVYGFDIMIDSDFKPWLIEINLSPSLACDSQIDLKIKSQLLADTFNLIGVRQFNRKAESANKAKNRMKSYQNRGKSVQGNRYGGFFNPLREIQDLNSQLGGAFNSFMARSISGKRGTNNDGVALNLTQAPNTHVLREIDKLENDGEFAQDIDMLKKLSTIRQKEILRETLLELLRKGNYVCIYPARGSESYDQYFHAVRPLNRYMNKVLFQTDTLAQLKVPTYNKAEYQEQQQQQSTPEQIVTNKTSIKHSSSAKLRRSQEGGNNFRTIKDQLEDIQKVAKQAERSMQNLNGMSAKSSTQTSLTLQAKGNNSASSKYLHMTQSLASGTTNELASKSCGTTLNAGKGATDVTKKRKLPDQTTTIVIDEVGQTSIEDAGEKSMTISGDDILIEYCERIRHALRQIPDSRVRPALQAQLVRFISHYVWQMADKIAPLPAQGKKGSQVTRQGAIKNQPQFHTRIQNRITEMKERRRRLLHQQHKAAAGKGAQNNFANMHAALIKKKREALSKYDSSQLEAVLRDSTKSAALELVMTLLPESTKHGILVDLEVSFGVKVNPQSPSFIQRGNEGKCFDLSGSQVQQAETNATLRGDSGDDAPAHSSPALAYSDMKGKLEASELRNAPSTSNFGRTNTGFSASTNFSNLKQHSLGASKQSSASGVVLLHDMTDRSKVQLVGKTQKMLAKPLVTDPNRAQSGQLSEAHFEISKSAKQSVLGMASSGARTNNFFMSSGSQRQDAPGSANISKRQFTMQNLPANSYDSSGGANVHKNMQMRQSHQQMGSQQAASGTSSIQEPSMVHATSMLPPSSRQLQNQMSKSNRLPPPSFHPRNQSARRKPNGQAGKNGATPQARNSYNNVYSRASSGFSKFNLPQSLNNVIQDFERAGGQVQQQPQMQKRGFTTGTPGARGISQQTQSRHQLNGQRSTNQMLGKSHMLATGQPGTSSHQIQVKSQVEVGFGAGIGGRSTRAAHEVELTSSMGPSQQTESIAASKMQNRIKSAVIGFHDPVDNKE